MRRSLRKAASALLIAAVLGALAAPAVAAPREEPVHAVSFRSPGVFVDLLAWFGQWLDLSPIQSIAAPGGHSMDPDGVAGSSSGAAADGGGATAEGGHSMDPDG